MERRSFYNEILTEHNLRPEFKRPARREHHDGGCEPQLRRPHLAQAQGEERRD